MQQDDDWEVRKAAMIAEYAAIVERLPVTDTPSPPLTTAAQRTIYTRRDTRGNVYGYFPGCLTEGVLGIAYAKD